MSIRYVSNCTYTPHPDPMKASFQALCRLHVALTEARDATDIGTPDYDRLTTSLERVEGAIREHQDPYWSTEPIEGQGP